MNARKKKSPSTTILYVKNMVCDRCIRVVGEELTKLGFDVRRIELGEAEVSGEITAKDLERVRGTFASNGFELIEDRNARLIEAVKTAIITLVHHRHDTHPMTVKFSDYIASRVGRDYHSLSVLFSSVENITIEHYLIRQKIERAKELMKYGDHTLSEIADMMNYSSVQHLSNQFKSVTGLTPSEFRKLSAARTPRARRIPIDQVK